MSINSCQSNFLTHVPYSQNYFYEEIAKGIQNKDLKKVERLLAQMTTQELATLNQKNTESKKIIKTVLDSFTFDDGFTAQQAIEFIQLFESYGANVDGYLKCSVSCNFRSSTQELIQLFEYFYAKNGLDFCILQDGFTEISSLDSNFLHGTSRNAVKQLLDWLLTKKEDLKGVDFSNYLLEQYYMSDGIQSKVNMLEFVVNTASSPSQILRRIVNPLHPSDQPLREYFLEWFFGNLKILTLRSPLLSDLIVDDEVIVPQEDRVYAFKKLVEQYFKQPKVGF